MAEAQNVQLTLHGDGVAAPARRMVAFVTEAVGTAIRALATDECKEQEAWGGAMGFKFNGLEMGPDERREAFTNWLLAKGFQDLARGIRETLEEAYFYLKVFAQGSFKTTVGEFNALLENIRHEAGKPNFPDLLGQVNAGLQEPLAFETEFLSLQRVRNCLEHRGGRVGPKDLDPVTGTLTLSFPRLKMYYMMNGEEVEVVPGEAISAEADDHPFRQGEVQIYIRRVTRSREYALNQPVEIALTDFLEIALACQMFTDDLATKLPTRSQSAASEDKPPLPVNGSTRRVSDK